VNRIVSTVEDLRRVVSESNVGLVPTMGALHEGHLSLIRRSAAENERTVVSIFVNPTQFSDPKDLERYPRDLDHDVDLAIQAGADIVFTPSVETIYPSSFSTTVEVGELSRRWEGEFRPGHFKGVATVVTILLNAVMPARSYFGEKDYQQLTVIRRMHRDLRLPGEIIGCPTVRDADGLALSSRNIRLSPVERAKAAAIPRSLFRIAELVKDGITDVDDLINAGIQELKSTSDMAIDYLAIVDPDTLEPLQFIIPNARALIAVRLGQMRLIDNLNISSQSP
jgi:pantoate--beta-alanine ligase